MTALLSEKFSVYKLQFVFLVYLTFSVLCLLLATYFAPFAFAQDAGSNNTDQTQSANCDPTGNIDPATWTLVAENTCDPSQPGNSGQEWSCNGTNKFSEDQPSGVCATNNTGGTGSTPTTSTNTGTTTGPDNSTTNVIENDPNSTDTNGVPISANNYGAPQNANYTLESLQHGLLCELAGMSPLGDCIGQVSKPDANGNPQPPQSFLFNKVPSGGAMGGLTNVAVAMFTNPPTSTAEYMASIGKNLGIIQPAYAAAPSGSGASIIAPVLKLWQVTRDLAYIIFIVVFIAVGFMIMFRTKLSPQAVITAQAALPGLIIGLILVTFSYFIASLLVDFSFLGMKVVAQLFDPTVVGTNALGNSSGAINSLAQNSNAFQLFMTAGLRPENVGDLLTGGYSTLFSGAGTAAVGTIILGIIGGIIGTLIAPGVGTIVGAGAGAAGGIPILSLIIPLVLIIALFIQFFRLLFQLITAYIGILVSTVTGPFIILSASIPGRSGGLALWWKSLLGNALVFPAVFAAFLFAGLILGTKPGDWQSSPPLFGGLNPILLRLIIAYGIIIGIPAIPGMVKKAIGVPDIQGIPHEATAGFLGGLNLGRTGVQEGYNRLWDNGAKPGENPKGPLARLYAGPIRARLPILPRLKPKPIT